MLPSKVIKMELCSSYAVIVTVYFCYYPDGFKKKKCVELSSSFFLTYFSFIIFKS